MLEKGCTEDHFSIGHKDDIHGVIHTAGDDRFDLPAIGSGPEDVGGAGDKLPARGQGVFLAGESSFAPVNIAIGAEIRAVQVVGTAGERLAIKPDFLPVGLAIPVGVRKLENLRRSGDIQGAFVPHRPFREHNVFHKDSGFIKDAISICIFQTEDTMRFFLELDLYIFIGAAGVGHVQPPLVVEGGGDGTRHQIAGGGHFDHKAVGQREGVAVEVELPGGWGSRWRCVRWRHRRCGYDASAIL